MIKGYRDFYYNVQNMNRAIVFFETLGFKKGTSHEYWTDMLLGDLRLGLHWTEGDAVPAIDGDDHGPHCGGTLTLLSDDVSTDRALVEKAGGRVRAESKQPWGHMLVFEDLDGNMMKLMNPTQR